MEASIKVFLLKIVILLSTKKKATEKLAGNKIFGENN